MFAFKPMLAAVTLTAVAALASPALAADTQPAAPQPAASQSSSAVAPKPSSYPNRVEARIAYLHEQLHITDAQAPQWKAVADVMRGNSKHYAELIQEKRKNVQTMTAVEDLRAYQEIAEAHAEGVKKMTAAFETLYASMSPEQKKAADEVFRQHHRRFSGRRMVQ